MENEIMPASPLKKEIALALAKVQGSIIPPKKDTDNPFFKSRYADLAGVWESVRGPLAANDLAFVQLPTTEGSRVSVTGILLHKSGESIESTISGSAKDAMPQSIGSCITYLRRYQMSAMLGIAAEDDDGAAASGTTSKEKTKAQERPGFSTGVPYDQHLQSQTVAGTTARPQVDHGDFEDVIVSAVAAESGKKKNGEPWTLYRIETRNHGTFSTFDAAVFDRATMAATLGAPVIVHSEATPKGPKVLGFGSIDDDVAATTQDSDARFGSKG
jgi:hypothetical protein